MPDRPSTLAFVALGANMGDRRETLEFARDEIARLPGTRTLAESSIEETEPLGVTDQPRFLNQMLAISTRLSPHELLAALLEVEQRAGRTRAIRWGPRTLDCDLVRYGDRVVRDDTLTVPHPEIANRDFWMRELEELEAMLTASREA